MNSELDVAETKRFASLGIIVIREGSKLLYFKPRKLSIEESVKETIEGQPQVEYELVPLTSEERQKYGIEESEHEEGKEIDIEESAEESIDEKLKKVREAEKAGKLVSPNELTLKGSPETVAAAKKILEDAQAKQKTDDGLADKILQFYKDTGDSRYLDCKSKEEMTSLTTSLMKEVVERKRGTPSGTAFSNEVRKPEDLYTKRYDSYESMIRDLREKARNGSREAESYLNSLWERFDEFKKRDVHSPVGTYDPNSKEALDELNLVKKGGVLTPADPADGDLGRLQKKWRDEKLRKMKNQAIQGAEP